MYAGGKQVCSIIERSGPKGKVIALSHYEFSGSRCPKPVEAMQVEQQGAIEIRWKDSSE